jgi:hypothetical protein
VLEPGAWAKVLVGLGGVGASGSCFLAGIASTAEEDGTYVSNASGSSGTLYKSDVAFLAVLAGVCLVMTVFGGLGLLIHKVRDGLVTDPYFSDRCASCTVPAARAGVR